MGEGDETRYIGACEDGRVTVRWGDDPLNYWSLSILQAESLVMALDDGLREHRTGER